MQRIWKVIDNLSPFYLILFLWIMAAPWPMAPEPHLVEKYNLLMQGNLTKPIDIFDVLWHGWPLIVGGMWVYRWVLRKQQKA